MFTAQIYFKIKSLVSNLQKKNIDETLIEINTTLKMYNEDERFPVISALLDELDFRDAKLKEDTKV